MKYLFCTIFKLLFCSASFGQYDIIIKSLVETPSNSPQRITGYFKKSREKQSGSDIEYYKFSESKVNFCYYPKQANVNCGYFVVFGKIIASDSNFENNLGCDLDYNSFELYSYTLNNSNYLILNAIRFGSGTTTRFVYCNLFDITDRRNIGYHSLSSIYGSGLSFGDYNNDNKIDFLEIRYAVNSGSTNEFKLTMKTYNDVRGDFFIVENKYIRFKRIYTTDSIRIIVSESNW